MNLMHWNRSDTLTLAFPRCAHCRGSGVRLGRRGRFGPCGCVLRAVFRACYHRFRECATKDKHMSRVTLEFSRGQAGRVTWGRKDEEFVADFCLVSRRALTDGQYRVFKCHYLLGADWRLCCRKLELDRGDFFHEVYRIEQRLGRVFCELKPYSLFPLDEYFNGATRAKVTPFFPGPQCVPVRAPVQPAPAAQDEDEVLLPLLCAA